MSSLNDFVIEDGVLKKYLGSGGDVVIPDGVYEIGKSAFSGCRELKSITIPGSVMRIRMSAFQGCKGLTTVTIPGNNTMINSWAFYECSPDLWFDVPANSRARKFADRYEDERLWSDENYNTH